jgi:hypothetical protein
MFWATLGVVLLALIGGFLWWPSKDRSVRTVLTTAMILASLVMLGIYITQIWPVQPIRLKEVVKTVGVDPPKVVYKDRVVYKDPRGMFVKPNMAEACKGGSPVQVLYLLVNGAQEEATDDKPAKDDLRTYVKVTIPGSNVMFVCQVPGDVSGFWKVGDVIVMSNGTPY